MTAALQDAPTEAPAASGAKIKLMSRYEKHGVRLESPEEIIDARHGKYQVPGTGKWIRFQNYRAEIPAEWWPLLESHSEQLLQRGVVGLAEGWTGLHPQSAGVQIHTGAVTGGVQEINRAPFEGWDAANGRELVAAIEEGKVPDLAHAEAYEWAHKRRKMVVRALVDARFGDEPAPPEPDIASDFHQPSPGGED